MPVWKFAAIVEAWLWAHVNEEHHKELTRVLHRDVHFEWASGGSMQGREHVTEPTRWQRNEKGESLLSKHRRKRQE